MGLRSILEATYEGRLTAYRRVFRKENGRTVQKDEAYLTEQPCALSWGGNYRQRGASLKQGLLPEIQYEARVFVSPDAEIPAGSRIVVAQNGVIRDFVTCGEAVKYPTHQEIIVTREDQA